MKIIVCTVVLLIAFYIIGRIGLRLHKLNVKKSSSSTNSFDQSLKNLEYALNSVGKIQCALNACTGDGTIKGLNDALKKYIYTTMVEGQDHYISELMLYGEFSGDDAMVAKSIGEEVRNNGLNIELIDEMNRRRVSSPNDYAKCAWELAIKLCGI